MMKRKLSPNSLLKGLLHILGWLHCGLLMAICCGVLFTFLYNEDVAREIRQYFSAPNAMSPLEAYLRGLLFCIPVGLSWFFAKKVPHLWQFLLISVVICGFTWALLGHPVGAVAAALCCFFRAANRASEEKKESSMDSPHFLGLLVFAGALLLGALSGAAQLQRLSVLSAAVYFLVCLTYNGVERISGYIVLNQGMHGLPARRIRRIAGAALIAAVVLTAALLLPAALGFSGDLRIEFKNTPGSAQTQQVQPAVQGMDMGEALRRAFGDDEKPFQIPPFVSYLFFALCFGGVGVLLFCGLYRFIRNLSFSFRDGRDEVRFLTRNSQDEEIIQGERSPRRPKVWDRSPNARIRRSYRKAVLAASKERPKSWQTPAEIEAAAKLDAPVLHSLYEKARYSPIPCIQEDLRRAKEKT